VDSIEPMLYPLLRRDVNHQNSRLTVQIGDKTVDYNKDFRQGIPTSSIVHVGSLWDWVDVCFYQYYRTDSKGRLQLSSQPEWFPKKAAITMIAFITLLFCFSYKQDTATTANPPYFNDPLASQSAVVVLGAQITQDDCPKLLLHENLQSQRDLLSFCSGCSW
jgi:hypothetical protein